MLDPYIVIGDLLSYNSYASILQILNEVTESMHLRSERNYNEMRQIQESGSLSVESAKSIEIKVPIKEEVHDITVTKESSATEEPTVHNKKIIRKPRKTKISV